MLFDVKSALAEILADTRARDSCDFSESAASKSRKSQESQPAPSEARQDAQRSPRVATPLRSRESQARITETESIPFNNLPTHPPACAACGLSDWTVAVTDKDGRRLHVFCWQRERV